MAAAPTLYINNLPVTNTIILGNHEYKTGIGRNSDRRIQFIKHQCHDLLQPVQRQLVNEKIVVVVYRRLADNSWESSPYATISLERILVHLHSFSLQGLRTGGSEPRRFSRLTHAQKEAVISDVVQGRRRVEIQNSNGYFPDAMIIRAT